MVKEGILMIYPHHQRAIDYITEKLKSDPQVLALIISGSIAHGFNDEKSDVDINIIVSNDLYEQKMSTQTLTYWESGTDFYDEGYFDGKYITLDYLDLVSKQGNEPTRFALQDSLIAFDRTGQVADYIKKIGTYDEGRIQKNTIRFLSQLEAWKWYCTEALKKQNGYLLDTSVSKFILFSGRLILLDNKFFFPYHKWFIKSLEKAPKKPLELMDTISKLLNCKSEENINALYQIIKDHKDWANGINLNWSSYFVHDVETVWMREEEFIENI
jgi:hypothetical protein